MYDDFAGIYDTLMDDYDYDAWSEYYLALIRDTLGKLPARMAECACGTGSLTVRFAKSGMNVAGIDLSASMLRRAEEKARRWGIEAAFVRQDMRKLVLPRRVGAVLCTCDGVNYLTTLEDVEQFFRRAYDQLLPGGILCFDCSSRHKLERVMGNAFFGEERDGLAMLWQNTLNQESHVLTMDVTFFVREEDGRFRRFREEHRQRAHHEQEITDLLKKTGFEDVRAYGEMRFDSPKETDIRIHYTARKPDEEEFEL